MDKGLVRQQKQSVVTNGTNSSSIPASSGVSQGSVLGSYINDLPEKMRSRVRLFADDTAMYLRISSLSEANILQEDLLVLKLEQWEVDMNFNPSKCQVWHVTRLKIPNPSKYLLHNTKFHIIILKVYLLPST